MFPPLPTILLTLFSVFLAGLLYHKRKTLVEIFSRWDASLIAGAEIYLVGQTYYQVWRFAYILGWLPSPTGKVSLPFTSPHVNQAAGTISHLLTDYWVSLLAGKLPLTLCALLAAATMTLIGLLYKHTSLRLIGTGLMGAFWVFAGVAFWAHAPAHDNGGAWFGIGAVGFFAWFQLLALKDAESPLYLVDLCVALKKNLQSWHARWKEAHGGSNWVKAGRIERRTEPR